MKSPMMGVIRRRGGRAYATAVVAWAVSLVAALILLPPGGARAQAADSSAVTVPGPALYDPAAGTQTGPAGSVTVDQTQNLTNQVVHVTWSGFTPTVGTTPQFLHQFVMYSVRVYQCRGTDPKITDCYGSSLFNADASAGFDQVPPAAGSTTPDFPSNMVLTSTRPDSPGANSGSGEAYIEVWTSRESQNLGCDSTHPCSIVVEPNYGGDALGYDSGTSDCTDHSLDSPAVGFGYEATDYVFNETGGPQGTFADGEYCAWQNRTVVPIHFAPAFGDCQPRNADFTAEGLPMLDRAMQQWDAGACLSSSDPTTVQYAGDLDEPAARKDFLAGRTGADMALTSYPADPTLAKAHPYTYVPLANSAIAVAFLVDDGQSHTRLTSMRLDARLLAKMLTQSYNYEPFATATVAPGNPSCVFDDPEFKKLNPDSATVTWPTCGAFSNIGNGNSTTIPIVTGGQTDLVQQLTTWIGDDPDAAAFLKGTPDPWGMVVDEKYQPPFAYPQESFVLQDSTGPDKDPSGNAWVGPQADRKIIKSFEWTPVQDGLDAVSRGMLSHQASCYDYDIDGLQGGHDKCSPQNLGDLGMFAIVDEARAAAYDWPTASLLNPAGAYVAPSTSSMLAAVGDMTTDTATGTQALAYGDSASPLATDASAYPLTGVDYAMAPISGIAPAKAAKISGFLREVAATGGGQVAGTVPGTMPAGFAPLTGAQQAQAAAGAAAVAPPAPASGNGGTTIIQGGQTVVNNYVSNVAGATGGAAGGSGGAVGNGGATAGGSASVGPPAPTTAGRTPSSPSAVSPTSLAPVAAGTPNPDQAGPARLVLPIVLIAGAVLFVLGPLGLLATSGALGGVRLPRRGGK
jgi:hypothetical protein